MDKILEDICVPLNRCIIQGRLKNSILAALDVIFIDFDNIILHSLSLCCLARSFILNHCTLLLPHKLSYFLNQPPLIFISGLIPYYYLPTFHICQYPDTGSIHFGFSLKYTLFLKIQFIAPKSFLICCLFLFSQSSSSNERIECQTW